MEVYTYYICSSVILTAFLIFMSAPAKISSLQPMHWEDNWPVIGVDFDRNGIGEPVYSWKKPIESSAFYTPMSSDDFSNTALSLQWQFNHNPVWNKFSFTEREGWLRLHTCNVTDSLYYAKNTITQRILGPISTATLKMDITNMKDGDVAGFSVFQWPYRSIAVVKEATRKLLQIRVYDKPQEELTFN